MLDSRDWALLKTPMEALAQAVSQGSTRLRLQTLHVATVNMANIQRRLVPRQIRVKIALQTPTHLLWQATKKSIVFATLARQAPTETHARSAPPARTKQTREMQSVTLARKTPTHPWKALPQRTASVMQDTMGLMAATAMHVPWANTKQIRGIRLLAVTTARRESIWILLAIMLRRTV